VKARCAILVLLLTVTAPLSALMCQAQCTHTAVRHACCPYASESGHGQHLAAPIVCSHSKSLPSAAIVAPITAVATPVWSTMVAQAERSSARTVQCIPDAASLPKFHLRI
jgi:hypothetical protein